MAALLFIVQAISIHALREEGDARRSPRISPLCISIHALREEGDQHGDKLLGLLAQFLSTPSARRATPPMCGSVGFVLFLSTPSARRATDLSHHCPPCSKISIHALREEGDV